MSGCDLMYSIKFVLLVLIAVNMNGFVNDSFIIVLVFTSDVLAPGDGNYPALFVCVSLHFFLRFLIFPVAYCYFSVSPSTDDDSEEFVRR